MTAQIVSKLAKFLQTGLKEGSTIAGERIEKEALRHGVKPEELRYAELPIDRSKRYTPEELTQLESQRSDVFGESNRYNDDTDYSEYVPESIRAAAKRPLGNYQERVLTFSNRGSAEQGSRYTSGHYPDEAAENYLMHTRFVDTPEIFDGTPSRVLVEIQSDLHQAGRQSGYGVLSAEAEAAVKYRYDVIAELSAELDATADPKEISRLNKLLQVEYNELSKLTGQPDHMVDFLVSEASSADELLSEFALHSAPKSPWQDSWLRKGIERELVDAYNQGLEQVAIPISGNKEALAKANRGAGVQKWHETEVLNTAKKVAKQTNSEFKEVTKDGITYAVIKPTGPFKATLYASPAAAYFAARSAFDEGYSEDEVRAYAEQNGYDYEELKAASDKIAEARKDGYSDDEIKQYLEQSVPALSEAETVEHQSPPLALTPSVQQAMAPTDLGMPASEIGNMLTQVSEGVARPKSDKEQARMQGLYEEAQRIIATGEDTRPWYRRWTEVPPETRVKLVEEQKGSAYAELISDAGLPIDKIVANLQTVYPNMTSVFTRTGAWFGNEADWRLANEAQMQSRKKIVEAAKDIPEFAARGLTLIWEAPTGDDYGNAFTDDGDFYVVDREGQKTLVTPGFFDSIRSEGYEISGAIAGGITGATAGARVPGPPLVKAGSSLLLSILGASGGSAVGSQLDYLENAIELQQNLEGQTAAARALSAGQASVIGDVIAWPIAKGLGAGAKSLGQLKDRLLNGREYEELKRLFFVSDDELEAMRQGLLKVTELPGNTQEQRIAALALTKPGAEDLMRQVSAVDPQASRAVSASIDARAKEVLRSADELADDQMARLLQEDLTNYTTDVKAFYQAVKEQAASAPRTTQFTFNFNELGIEPALEAMEKEIVDAPAVERFLRRAHVIRSRSDARTFADLLELRQLVNEFKFGSGMKRATDLKIFNDVLTKIDTAIDQGADVVFDSPQQWKAQYAAARAKYAEMKQLERNVLARALRRPGLDTDSAVRAITRYMSASDETFSDVLKILPQQAREKVEGSAIKALAEKYTTGVGEGMRATHFPLLADELSKMPFTTKDARRMQAALIKMGEVFKNDVALARHTGNIVIPKEQSYLTTDPVVRLHYAFASSVFNYVRRLAPGEQNRALALIMKTADLLENPLNAKTSKELADLAGADVDVVPSIVQMQQAAARQTATQKDPMAAKIKLWGDSNTLSLKGSGTPSQVIPMHRIATLQQVNTLAAKYGINPADKKAMDWALKQEGFVAVAQGTEKVRLLK